jgi:hypothetical protein
VTLDGRPQRLQLVSTAQPRTVMQAAMSPADVACLHVQAYDRLQNASPEQVLCSRALAAPPMPHWTGTTARVVANPEGIGLVGLDSWMWLDPAPRAVTVHEVEGATDYSITATPLSTQWDFGDGARVDLTGPAGYGLPYPQKSPVAHVFEAHDQIGYLVQASVTYTVTWMAITAGKIAGPFPMGTFVQAASSLVYPVEQAQPELLQI